MSNTLTEEDIWFCERMANNHANSGYLVTTKKGLIRKLLKRLNFTIQTNLKSKPFNWL